MNQSIGSWSNDGMMVTAGGVVLLHCPPSAAHPSTVERTEAALREAGLAGRFWRGDALSASTLPSRPSGFRALDEQLPDGGWPSRCMTELLLPHTGVGEIRFLASTLSSLTQEGREIILLSPPLIPDPRHGGRWRSGARLCPPVRRSGGRRRRDRGDHRLDRDRAGRNRHHPG